MMRTIQLTKEQLIKAIEESFKDYSQFDIVAIVVETENDKQSEAQSVHFCDVLDV